MGKDPLKMVKVRYLRKATRDMDRFRNWKGNLKFYLSKRGMEEYLKEADL